MNWAAIIWLVLLVLFLLTEAATVTMVSLWFAVSALAALIVSLLGGPVWLQTLLFLVVSAVLLALLTLLVLLALGSRGRSLSLHPRRPKPRRPPGSLPPMWTVWLVPPDW